MKIIKETDDYIKIDYEDGGPTWPSSVGRENKYPCIGGPFDGQKKAYTQVADDQHSYVGYNCADNARWTKPKFPKKIWLYRSML